MGSYVNFLLSMFLILLFISAIHYWAHTFNFENFMNARDEPGLLSALSNLREDWINPIGPGSTVCMQMIIQIKTLVVK